MKKNLILLFLGFMGGMVYYNLLIDTNPVSVVAQEVKKEETVEVVEEVKEETKKEVKEEVKYICPFDKVTCKIQDVANKYDMDWKLAVAISKHETAVYTSYAFKQLNNVGGMMYWNGKSTSLRSYNTLDDGIDAFVRNLKNNYINQGLTSIEQIQKKYAPIGADNDPNNLNSHWVKGVYKYYNELNEK